MGRLLELKYEMIELEKTEFHYIDDICQDMKLTHHDIELPVPKYFKHTRGEAFHEREKVLAKILEKIGENQEAKKNLGPQMRLEEAIRHLQVHERGRQGRLRAKFMWELSREEERRLKGAKGKRKGTQKVLIRVLLFKFRLFNN